MKQVHLLILGLVQGVSFRAGIRLQASQLGLGGWVRNTPDGSIEVLAEGEEEQLGQLVNYCRRGPAGAVVKKVLEDWKEENQAKFNDFRVRY